MVIIDFYPPAFDSPSVDLQRNYYVDPYEEILV